MITSSAFHQCGVKFCQTEEWVTIMLTPKIDPIRA